MKKMEKIIIRNAETNDFNSIFLLLKQLWPDDKLNKIALKKYMSSLLKLSKKKPFVQRLKGKWSDFALFR